MADADDIAIAALGWLAGDGELFTRFLAVSGLSADSIRRAAAEPGFMAGVLAFLMNHEPTLLAFSTATGTAPETVARAYRTLSGEDGRNGVDA